MEGGGAQTQVRVGTPGPRPRPPLYNPERKIKQKQAPPVDQRRSFFVGPGDPDDLTYEQKHGYLFEVPVGRGPGELEAGELITQAGRFAHEGAAADPTTGIVYMTEDDFAYDFGSSGTSRPTTKPSY
jgi:hypothetical protein